MRGYREKKKYIYDGAICSSHTERNNNYNMILLSELNQQRLILHVCLNHTYFLGSSNQGLSKSALIVLSLCNSQ